LTEVPSHGSLVLRPIAYARTPFVDRASAPRQPSEAHDVPGRIEFVKDGRFEHALSDLSEFSHVWVLFWFHLNDGWKAKVRPPRSEGRRGVFATRSPHRPNPLGMSVVRLDRIDGLTLHVRDVDLVDGTPVLDLKPYLAYTDSKPGASHGWLSEVAPGVGAFDAGPPTDPGPRFSVTLGSAARLQLAFLRARGVDLLPRIESVLGAGPSPHPYRRIRRHGETFVLAIQEWRVHFGVMGGTVTIFAVASGYKPSEVFSERSPLGLHREYAEQFGLGGEREGVA
jgi:tRNA-Thr(GGU) m(6)t(6)A37 methyltransferase TsaA